MRIGVIEEGPRLCSGGPDQSQGAKGPDQSLGCAEDQGLHINTKFKFESLLYLFWKDDKNRISHA